MEGNEGYADQLRRVAAAARGLAETQVELAEAFHGLSELGFDTARMVDLSERGARFVGQIGSVHAAQALAYDDLMAAGGPGNSRAYVEYEAATRRNTALLPRESLSE